MIIQSQDDLSVDLTQDTGALWERDISRYVWHESVNDIPLASLWGNQSGNNTKTQSSDGDGLALKARGCTPAVQRSVLPGLFLFAKKDLPHQQYFDAHVEY